MKEPKQYYLQCMIIYISLVNYYFKIIINVKIRKNNKL